MSSDTPNSGPEPARPRAVFSSEDFRLLRVAVGYYMRQTEVDLGPDANRYATLYHRLGRLE